MEFIVVLERNGVEVFRGAVNSEDTDYIRLQEEYGEPATLSCQVTSVSASIQDTRVR